jgi:hypothetical protein
MDPTSTLQLIAQLAVAMAGFSSVVVAYGRRFEDGWKASDRIRLSLLVGDSLAVMFFALLPLVLQGYRLEASLIWGLASASLGLYVFTRSLMILPRVRGNVGTGMGSLHPLVIALTALCLVGTVALQIFNLLGPQTVHAGPFVTGLWLLLSSASMQFLRLVFTNLDP